MTTMLRISVSRHTYKKIFEGNLFSATVQGVYNYGLNKPSLAIYVVFSCP